MSEKASRGQGLRGEGDAAMSLETDVIKYRVMHKLAQRLKDSLEGVEGFLGDVGATEDDFEAATELLGSAYESVVRIMEKY